MKRNPTLRIQERREMCFMKFRYKIGLGIRFLSLLLAGSLFVFCLSNRSLAQAPGTGAIVGSVSDPSGAAVPNAQVTLTNEATGLSRIVVSTQEGVFRSTLLPPGTYAVKV